MSDKSAIEWTDATWNPVTGCTRVSPGCAHCYIEHTPPFRIEGRRFELVDGAETTGVRLHEDRLEQPLRWRRPRRVFVNSLSDLFHEDIPESFVWRAIDVMRLAPQHTFQVLTKRPERMRDVVERYYSLTFQGEAAYPLPNVWLGVSVENARYTWRADVLRETPAAVRFVSAEPLLGSLFAPGSSAADTSVGERQGRQPGAKAPLDLTGIDWVIVGGESGPGARPMHPGWAREIRDACACSTCCADPAVDADVRRPGMVPVAAFGAGWQQPQRITSTTALQGWNTCHVCGGTGRSTTAFFFKQWGEWTTHRQFYGRGDDTTPHRFGKKRAGRELDGRTWDEYPAREAVPA